MTDPVAIRQVFEDEIEVQVNGTTYRTQAACPHRKGRLTFALVNSRTLRITCPLHHSTFDLSTGRRLAGPACADLAVSGGSPSIGADG
jgi:nitrite reductase (NADH) small subunit